MVVPVICFCTLVGWAKALAVPVNHRTSGTLRFARPTPGADGLMVALSERTCGVHTHELDTPSRH